MNLSDLMLSYISSYLNVNQLQDAFLEPKSNHFKFQMFFNLVEGKWSCDRNVWWKISHQSSDYSWHKWWAQVNKWVECW